MFKSIRISLLIFLFIPIPAQACSCRQKISSVKANMHTLQTLVETYAAEHHGKYPQHVDTLYRGLKHNQIPSWRNFTNPFSSQSGKGDSYDDFLQYKPPQKLEYVWGLRVIKPGQVPDSGSAGLVLYAPVSQSTYRIYGVDENGKLIRDQKRLLVLTNG